MCEQGKGDIWERSPPGHYSGLKGLILVGVCCHFLDFRLATRSLEMRRAEAVHSERTIKGPQIRNPQRERGIWLSEHSLFDIRGMVVMCPQFKSQFIAMGLAVIAAGRLESEPQDSRSQCHIGLNDWRTHLNPLKSP